MSDDTLPPKRFEIVQPERRIARSSQTSPFSFLTAGRAIIETVYARAARSVFTAAESIEDNRAGRRSRSRTPRAS